MIILSLVLAHLVGDFYWLNDEKVKTNGQRLSRHVGQHFLLTFLTLLLLYLFSEHSQQFFFQVVGATAALGLMHYVIDRSKLIFFQREYKSG